MIQGDGSGVVRIGMQEGRLAARQDARDHRPHQRPGVTPPARVGMGADARDLGEAVRLEPLARHGQQPPVLLDPEEVAQSVRLVEEGPRLGQGRQRQHGRGVGFGQGLYSDVARLGRSQIDQNHLRQHRLLQHRQARRDGRALRLDRGQQPLGLLQRRDGRQAFRRLIDAGDEDTVTRRQPQRPARPYGQGRLTRRRQGVPDRTIQRVRHSAQPCQKPTIFLTSAIVGSATSRAFSAPEARARSISAGSFIRRRISAVTFAIEDTASSASFGLKAPKP
ncbi:hypothetical protein D3C73_1057930 [compost metagenome]